MLDARDDNQALAAAKADFDAERDSLMAKISELETELRNAPRPGPQLVSVDGEELPVPPLVSPAANTDTPPTDLDSLRASIDEMTASLTANAAIELDGQDRINALLDEAEQDGADSNLVTSLVEARDRLRSKKKGPARSGSSKASTKAPAKTTGSRKSAKSTAGKSKDTSGSKIVAATASGATAEKSTSMPRASENDLKVI